MLDGLSAEGWVIVITAVGAGILAILKPWWSNKRTVRADTIAEWKGIADRQEKAIDKLMKDRDDQGTEIRNLTQQIFKIHESYSASLARSAACEARSAEQQAEIKLLQSAMQRQQQISGDVTGDIPGLVIADIHGTIMEFSPSLTPLLHYLPRDVRGKNVDMFIPDRFLGAHRKGMEGIRATDTPPWSERIILGYGITKEGTEVPVSITLSAWKTAKGEWLISATVRRRLQDPAASGILKTGATT